MARSCLIRLNHRREVVGEDTTTQLPHLDLLPLLLAWSFTTKQPRRPRWRRLPKLPVASHSPTMACPSLRLRCSNLLFSHRHSPWRYSNTLLPNPSLYLRQCHLAHDLCGHLSGSLDSPSESVNRASECRFLQRRRLALPSRSHESGPWQRHNRPCSRREPTPCLNSTTLKSRGRRRKCVSVSGRRGNNGKEGESESESENENERGREKWYASRSGRRCGLSKSRKSPLHRTITSSLAIGSREALVASLSRDRPCKSQADLQRMLLSQCSSSPSSSLLRSK